MSSSHFVPGLADDDMVPDSTDLKRNYRMRVRRSLAADRMTTCRWPENRVSSQRRFVLAAIRHGGSIDWLRCGTLEPQANRGQACLSDNVPENAPGHCGGNIQ